MDESKLVLNKTFRYPVLYRVTALFGALLFGLIVAASAIAVIDAMRTGQGIAFLLLLSLLVGVILILWGLDFATRSITAAPDGLQVRWLLRRSRVPWPDVITWRYLPLNLIHIRLRKGAGLYIWPLLENYTDLLDEIDARRRDSLRS
jgi:hypothetical protein